MYKMIQLALPESDKKIEKKIKNPTPIRSDPRNPTLCDSASATLPVEMVQFILKLLLKLPMLT